MTNRNFYDKDLFRYFFVIFESNISCVCEMDLHKAANTIKTNTPRNS